MDTSTKEYTDRLQSLQTKWWKKLIPVHLPYKLNLLSCKPGFTLEIGCGIGRCLKFINGHGVGIDHSSTSVEHVKSLGYNAFLPDDFLKSEFTLNTQFDSLLFSHVLEHCTFDESVNLINSYKKYLKRDGKIILITPQEVGYLSDQTHITFADFKLLHEVLSKTGFKLISNYSFPFPRPVGKLFIYNEFVVIGKFHIIS